MTDADLDARYRAGATMAKISADAGIPASSVRSRLLAFGTVIRPKGAPKINFDLAQKMIDSGHSQGAVARAHGVTKQAISMAIRRQRLRPAQAAERTA